jgi:hypothetical protein
MENISEAKDAQNAGDDECEKKRPFSGPWAQERLASLRQNFCAFVE